MSQLLPNVIGLVVLPQDFKTLREILLGWLGEQVDMTGPECDLARNLLAQISQGSSPPA